jgi:hypothetical protein
LWQETIFNGRKENMRMFTRGKKSRDCGTLIKSNLFYSQGANSNICLVQARVAPENKIIKSYKVHIFNKQYEKH